MFKLQDKKKYLITPSMIIKFGLDNELLVINSYPYYKFRPSPSI